MPRIVFTQQPKLPRDWLHLDYQKGDTVELSTDMCNRWIRRGVAEFAREPEPRKVERESARKEPEVAQTVQSIVPAQGHATGTSSGASSGTSGASSSGASGSTSTAKP